MLHSSGPRFCLSLIIVFLQSIWLACFRMNWSMQTCFCVARWVWTSSRRQRLSSTSPRTRLTSTSSASSLLTTRQRASSPSMTWGDISRSVCQRMSLTRGTKWKMHHKPYWWSRGEKIDTWQFFTHFLPRLLNIDAWKSQTHDRECWLFVPCSLSQWCCKQGQNVWWKHQLYQQPTSFCWLLVKSEPTASWCV